MRCGSIIVLVIAHPICHEIVVGVEFSAWPGGFMVPLMEQVPNYLAALRAGPLQPVLVYQDAAVTVLLQPRAHEFRFEEEQFSRATATR
jgi:hypothetical protein